MAPHTRLQHPKTAPEQQKRHPDTSRQAGNLCIQSDVLLERATGIEPALSAWEAEVLPLNYAREAPSTQSVLPTQLVHHSGSLEFSPKLRT